MDFFTFAQFIVRFSPLTAMDLYSMWAFLAAYVLVHWPIYRCYMAMDQRLTDFVRAYVCNMKGIVTEGNFTSKLLNELMTLHKKPNQN